MRKHRILVVDDEPDILASLAKLLPMLIKDVDVTSATSGGEALEILQDETFELVISDYKMPQMDGMEFLKLAKERQPKLQTVLMTAFPDVRLAAEAKRSAGVVAFLPKPFDLEQLVEIVQENLD